MSPPTQGLLVQRSRAGTAGTVRHSRGLSLIEVLIVVLLFSFGLTGLVAIQARAVQFSVSAEDTGRAALLANELATQMWAANTVNLPEADVAAWATRVADTSNGGLPNSTTAVEVTGNVARVTIQWRAPRAADGQGNRYVTDILIAAPAAASAP
jgi:type IV pilus assembly protein PilV